MEALAPKLKQYGKVKISEPLSKHTSFKIGGSARFFVSPETLESHVELMQYLDGIGVSYVILGGGSNMLAPDTGFDGVVIHPEYQEIKREGSKVIADAGALTVSVARFSMKEQLTGFEWGVGVPGTIGGAVRGNAGAMGFEMKDSVTKVKVYQDGEVVDFNIEQCAFEYRSSIFKRKGGVVLQVTLELEQTENKELIKQALEYLNYRNSTQPQGHASTGCIFQNPDVGKYRPQLIEHFDKYSEHVQKFLALGKISAGWLIEQAGLKGEQVGQALVSEQHGNFIVNLGGATSHDVRTLIDRIKETVYTKFGITLEEEIYTF
ncbi:MAG: UDP-N-acetylmuramate dehydrogenase [Candidatus Magasanikbacteria bacterium]|nr:UDP-N-acetylmuramate dehydrogenase [Candidatus Magasanikbacteria bacterium]